MLVMTLRQMALMIAVVVATSLPLMAQEQDRIRDVKIDGFVVVDQNGVVDPVGLLKLSCEPLATLRFRYLVDNGWCFRRQGYYHFFFKKMCASTEVDNQALYDRMDVSVWKAIEDIKSVENRKGCRRIEN